MICLKNSFVIIFHELSNIFFRFSLRSTVAEIEGGSPPPPRSRRWKLWSASGARVNRAATETSVLSDNVYTRCSSGSGAGSLTRALRPALLGATVSGMLPVSWSDGSWKLCSVAAVRSALISALLLALYLLIGITRPGVLRVSSAAEVFTVIRFAQAPLRWAGMLVWLWANAPQLEAYTQAWRRYEESFGAVDLRPTVRYVRRYAFFVGPLLLSFPFAITRDYAEYPGWLQAAMIVSICGIYGGICFWTIILDGACSSFADAFSEIDSRMQVALRKGNVPQLRRLTRQHGHLSRLSRMFCRTFGGIVAFNIYTTLLDISLGMYMNIRPSNPEQGGSLVRITIERLFSPVRLLLLKLTTTAGQQVIQQSQQAAELLRDHMLASSRSVDDPELEEILHKLEGQQVEMNMGGYFTLDKELFIQCVKDVVTLIIALAQFDLADPK